MSGLAGVGILVTEFEELALKKIAKDFLIDSVYARFNALLGKCGISNSEISREIGWDPAGYNQKYNRSNDLRITTFIKIYVALTDLIAAKQCELGFEGLDLVDIKLDDLISKDEIEVGSLFNHISAAAEGRSKFLDKEGYVKTYKRMGSFVFLSKNSKRFNDREIEVYVSYYKAIQG